jgi:uncharacterized protein YbjT (DUF2867 family)
MPNPILITGASGGQQGSTGRMIAIHLLEQGLPVRAFIHKIDVRCDELRQCGAEIFEGDLLNPASVQKAMEDVDRAYFTYPVTDGLLEATTIFAASARDAGLKLIVNNSQAQGLPDDPAFRSLIYSASFRNLQHRLADRIFDWAEVGAVHLQAPPYYENVRALISQSVIEQDAGFLPWGDGDAVIPLIGAQDVARVASTLLAQPDLPLERVFPLVTEAPTVHEIVDTLSKAIGRSIRYEPITDEQWVQAVKQRINPHAVDHLSHLWKYFRETKQRSQPTDTVRRITGRDPQTLEDFFRANASSFRTAAATSTSL